MGKLKLELKKQKEIKLMRSQRKKNFQLLGQTKFRKLEKNEP